MSNEHDKSRCRSVFWRSYETQIITNVQASFSRPVVRKIHISVPVPILILKDGYDQPLSATQDCVAPRVELLLGHTSVVQRVEVIDARSLRAALNVVV